MSGTRLLTAAELIYEYGDKMPDRRCSCCGLFKVFQIMYARPHTIVLLCASCDVDLASKS